jgi:16S rRNA (cytidine1402-2'-O)-methyltransferase
MIRAAGVRCCDERPQGRLYLVPAPLDFGCDSQAPLSDSAARHTLQSQPGWTTGSARTPNPRVPTSSAWMRCTRWRSRCRRSAFQELPREVHKKGDHHGQFDARPLLARP